MNPTFYGWYFDPPDPRYANKEPWGEVVGDDVEAHLPREDELEARGAVVHPQGHVVTVLGPQRLETYSNEGKFSKLQLDRKYLD